ncbi:4-hydroxyphenylpyruvate dioxygenase-like protein isoform X1 [Procambarus clarkii]|uniref:4-hydroxyphenylpyruvate dioxygenase-like protein isoform X1 n=2 Tax=Procambarus clarkii TaxID=6728 RepID=UPI0037448A95
MPSDKPSSMSCSVLHHVEACVKGNKLVTLLTNGFGFRPFAQRLTPRASQLALRNGNSIFVVTRRNSLSGIQNQQDDNATVKCQATNIFINNKQSNSQYFSDISKNKEHFKKLSSKTHQSSCTEDSWNLTKGYCNNETEPKSILNQYNEHWTAFCCRDEAAHTIDSVFNVALVVKDVDSVTELVRSQGGQVLREPADISDDFGHVRYSIVTSCCGNIVHTLINKNNYKGDFLPGYETTEDLNEYAGQENKVNKHLFDNCISFANNVNSPSVIQDINVSDGIPKQKYMDLHKFTSSLDKVATPIQRPNDHVPILTHFDHITYVCEAGKSKDLIAWYEKCFGMQRFMANREENVEEGFVLGGNIGLRLKVLEYWQCAETGLAFPTASTGDSSLKLVIAEPLPDVSESQINSFLQAHKGPGIQHIALHTPTMTATVKQISDKGIAFRKPPPVYYQEGIKLEEIEEAGHGEEVNLFKELGILLDSEIDVFGNNEVPDEKSYLMQVFTMPLFEEDTFFLEIIQRCGATGFGAGNITALAKSIILYNEQAKRNELKE